jgi:hypothetical protein
MDIAINFFLRLLRFKTYRRCQDTRLMRRSSDPKREAKMSSDEAFTQTSSELVRGALNGRSPFFF